MLNRLIFLLLGAALLLSGHHVKTVQADDAIVFPYNDKPCTCAGLNCTCCHGINVVPLNMKKNVCLQFALNLLPVQATVNIQLDNSTIATFVVDPRNPPAYCIPVLMPGTVAMCVKLHDIKLVGLSGLQICSTFYANFQSSDIFSQELPCVKLGMDGVSMIQV